MKLNRKIPIWFFLIPILLIATGLVIQQLDADSLDDDEKNSVKHLVNFGQRFTLGDTVASVIRTSPEHVPAFHLQLSIWSDFVGLHFVSLRAMSLFYFALSIAMAYRLANDLFGGKSALFTAFVVAFSAFHMNYAHEIRMYALVVVQTLVILWSYWRISVSPKSTHWYHLVILLVFSIYGMYTHNLIIFPLLSIGVYHLLFAPKTKQWWTVTGIEILAGIAFLPWLPNTLSGASGFEDLTVSHQSFIEVLFNSLFIYSNGFWIVVVLLIGLVIWKFPKSNKNLSFILVTFGAMTVAVLIFNEAFSYIPTRRMRYTLIWLPSLAIIVGLGFTMIFRLNRRVVGVLLVGWLVMFVWFLGSDELYHFSNLQNSQFRERFPFHIVGDEIKNQYDSLLGQDNRLVFFDSVFDYQPNLLNYYETIYHRKLEFLSLPLTDDHIDRLDKIDNSFPGFWFAYRPADENRLLEWQEDNLVRAVFDKYSMCLDVLNRVDVRLLYYLDRPVPCELVTEPNPQPITFDNNYRLHNYEIEYIDEQVYFSAWWNNPDMVFDSSYGFSIQVFRGDEKVGQIDYPIDNVVTHNQISLSNSESGIYSVRMILYSSADVKSVSGQTHAGLIFERDIELGQIEINSRD